MGDDKLSNPTIDGWFDQSVFVISEPGVFGNNGRNVVAGPGGNNIDHMLGKRFRVPNLGAHIAVSLRSLQLHEHAAIRRACGHQVASRDRND